MIFDFLVSLPECNQHGAIVNLEHLFSGLNASANAYHGLMDVDVQYNEMVVDVTMVVDSLIDGSFSPQVVVNHV